MGCPVASECVNCDPCAVCGRDDYTREDEYYEARLPYAATYLPDTTSSAIHAIRHNAECVRKAVAMSGDTIRSLSKESLDELHQIMENTSLLVMSQVDVIRKALEGRT